MNRKEAIFLLKELLESCTGLDEHYLKLESQTAASPVEEDYQIVIKSSLNAETQTCLIDILKKNELSYQAGSIWRTKRSINKAEPDTFIIYKAKKK